MLDAVDANYDVGKGFVHDSRFGAAAGEANTQSESLKFVRCWMMETGNIETTIIEQIEYDWKLNTGGKLEMKMKGFDNFVVFPQDRLKNDRP